MILKSIQSKSKIMQAACGCHIGKKRGNNEDNFYFDGKFMDSDNTGLAEILTKQISRLEGILDGYHFYAVFDGMGGGSYGEIASNLSAAAAKRFFEDENNMNLCDITPSLTQLCQNMNADVFQTGQNLGAYQMGSTIVSLFFYAGQVWVCNLGDSRCYRLRRAKMKRLSVDHTDEADVKAHGITGRKPYLTQYLGIDPEEMRIEPHIKSYPVENGDRFLLCCDGLTDMVSEQEICNMLAKYGSPEDCVKYLMGAALENGGRDNITIIVCQIG